MVAALNKYDTDLPDIDEETLKQGDLLLHGQYRIDRYLSAGGFGITYFAFDSLERKVVIKECFPNSMCARNGSAVRARSRAMQGDFDAVVRQFGREAQRMSKLRHRNIVGVHQVFEDNGTAYMALDLIRGRDLADIVETDHASLTPADIKDMLLRMLEAIEYVHGRNVLHRDISPDNILIEEDGNPVLIDFGAAREVASKASRMLSSLHIVKDGYSPQEFYLANGTQGPSSDLYSLAATFYHLITGAPPPNSQVRLAALAADEPDPFVPIPPRTEGFDHFFINAINQALAVFPKDRLQSAQAWIEEIDRERRQQAMRETAKKDHDIESVIREMTVETNRDLEASAKREKSAKRKRKQNAAEQDTPTQMVSVPRRVRPVNEGAPERKVPRLPADKPFGTSDQAIAASAKQPRSMLRRVMHFTASLVLGRRHLPRQ